MRYVIMSVGAAVLIGYDAIYNNGHYINATIKAVEGWWGSTERFVMSFF